MKQFKKAISLVAVLAFLITALVPVAALAAKTTFTPSATSDTYTLAKGQQLKLKAADAGYLWWAASAIGAAGDPVAASPEIKATGSAKAAANGTETLTGVSASTGTTINVSSAEATTADTTALTIKVSALAAGVKTSSAAADWLTNSWAANQSGGTQDVLAGSAPVLSAYWTNGSGALQAISSNGVAKAQFDAAEGAYSQVSYTWQSASAAGGPWTTIQGAGANVTAGGNTIAGSEYSPAISANAGGTELYYRCVVAGVDGNDDAVAEASQATFHLSVKAKMTVTTEPSSADGPITYVEGQTAPANFTTTVEGGVPSGSNYAKFEWFYGTEADVIKGDATAIKTVTNTTSPNTYSTSTSDGGALTAEDYLLSAAAGTTVPFTVKVTDSQGNVAYQTITYKIVAPSEFKVTGEPNPATPFTFTQGSTEANPGELTVSAEGGNPSYTFQWHIGTEGGPAPAGGAITQAVTDPLSSKLDVNDASVKPYFASASGSLKIYCVVTDSAAPTPNKETVEFTYNITPATTLEATSVPANGQLEIIQGANEAPAMQVVPSGGAPAYTVTWYKNTEAEVSAAITANNLRTLDTVTSPGEGTFGTGNLTCTPAAAVVQGVSNQPPSNTVLTYTAVITDQLTASTPATHRVLKEFTYKIAAATAEMTVTQTPAAGTVLNFVEGSADADVPPMQIDIAGGVPAYVITWYPTVAGSGSPIAEAGTPNGTGVTTTVTSTGGTSICKPPASLFATTPVGNRIQFTVSVGDQNTDEDNPAKIYTFTYAVVDEATGAAITAQPTNQSVTAPTTATFTVAATNATGYQWQVKKGDADWADCTAADGTGATTASFTTSATTTEMSGYQYQCIVSGPEGTQPVTTNAATLTVTSGGITPPATLTLNPITLTTGDNPVQVTDTTGAVPEGEWNLSPDAQQYFEISTNGVVSIKEDADPGANPGEYENAIIFTPTGGAPIYASIAVPPTGTTLTENASGPQTSGQDAFTWEEDATETNTNSLNVVLTGADSYNASYQWYETDDPDDLVSGELITDPGANTATWTPTNAYLDTLTAGPHYFYCDVTLTPKTGRAVLTTITLKAGPLRITIVPKVPSLTGNLCWAMQIPDDPDRTAAQYASVTVFEAMTNGKMPTYENLNGKAGLQLWHDTATEGTTMQVPENSRFEIYVPIATTFPGFLGSANAGTRNNYLEWEYRTSGTTITTPGGDVYSIQDGKGFYGVDNYILTSGPVSANMDGLQYRLVWRQNNNVVTTSQWITLDVTGADKTPEVPEVTISSAPSAEQGTVNVTQTGNVTLTASVQSGLLSADLAYQWQSRPKATASVPSPAWTNIANATSATYTIENVESELDGVSYQCVVSNNAFSGIAGKSNILTLKVNSDAGAVVFKTPNTGQMIYRYTDKTASFEADAATNNGDTVTYQWYMRASIGPLESVSPIATPTEAQAYLSTHPTTQTLVGGATDKTYETQPLKEGVYEYVCRATNATNTSQMATSPGFFVIVTQRSRIPHFTEQPDGPYPNRPTVATGAPQNMGVYGFVQGTTATISVKAEVQSQEPITYQWQATQTAVTSGTYRVPVANSWSDLTGQTSSTLRIANLNGDYNSWFFRCVAKNAAAGTEQASNPFILYVWNKADMPVADSIHRTANATTDTPTLTCTATMPSYAEGGLRNLRVIWTLNGNIVRDTPIAPNATTGVYEDTVPAANGTWECYWINTNVTGTPSVNTAANYWPIAASNGFVYGNPPAKFISVQPGNVETAVGTTATFAVGATLAPVNGQPLANGDSLVYVWQRSVDGGVTWRNCTANDGSGQFTSTFSVPVTQSVYEYAIAANMQGVENPFTFRVMVTDRVYGYDPVSGSPIPEYSDIVRLLPKAGTEVQPSITVKDGQENLTISTDPTVGKILSGSALTVTKDGHKVSEVLDMLSWAPANDSYALRAANASNEALKADDIIGTGCKIQLIDTANNDTVLDTITVIVRGDVMGSGVISLTQLVKMAAALKTTDPTKLEGAYLLAGDFDGNGEISLTDLVQEATIYRAEILDAGATPAPTAEPTAEPTTEPTSSATAEPTTAPTTEPTAAPTTEPTATPTAAPTGSPSAAA